MYKALLKDARRLEKRLNTDYAYEHAGVWEKFEKRAKTALEEGQITPAQFNDLMLIAFYDYFDLIEIEEE